MNGAEALLRTLAAGGVDICFANPGTTEMDLVAALERVEAIRPVLGLFEGVCTGAADGYSRVTGRPSSTLVHLGPGFANGLANLHNARRARSPVISIVGDHATWHRSADAPLTSDALGLARPMSVWAADVVEAADVGRLTADALAAATAPNGGPATLIVAQDTMWAHDVEVGVVVDAEPPAPVADTAIAAAADLVRRGGALLLGGDALEPDALGDAARVRAAGARVWVEVFPARQVRGRGLPAFDRLPYFPEQAREVLAGPGVVLVGAPDPVAFFGYANGTSRLVDDEAEVVTLAGPGDDAPGGLAALADALDAPEATTEEREPVAPPTGELGVASLGEAVVATLGDDAIVVEEAATSALGFSAGSSAAAPHVSLHLTGGAIGQGLPNAVGAALGAPGQRVVALQADGSGLYTAQSLWTMAREALDVTVVICANRAYRILQFEYGRMMEAAPGPRAAPLMDLTAPAVDWTALAAGFGVPASRATTADELVDALTAAHVTPGPTLIEAILA